MKNRNYIWAAIGISIVIIGNCYKSKKTESEKSIPTKVEKIACMTCGKDLTNDYNRMLTPSGNAWWCTPCYQATMNEVYDDMEAKGYSTTH